MKRFVEGENRYQSTLSPGTLDDYVTEDNPVRVIDVLVEELDLGQLGFDGVDPKATGRPAYHPSVLLKIYIYGYLNRVQSSRRLVQEDYEGAKRITLVMDNLNTHTGASLYKAFPPEMARSLLDKLEFVYTPKHGSWLNMAECEFSVLSRQCLSRRLADRGTVAKEIAAWMEHRNQKTWSTDWRFTTEDARIKLKRLYPKL